MTKGEYGEKRYQVALHCARLLGKDVEHRYSTFDLAGCIYSLRNSAVHSGELTNDDLKKTRFKGEDLGEVLEKGGQLVANAKVRCIELGDIPEWKRLLLGERDANAPGTDEPAPGA